MLLLAFACAPEHPVRSAKDIPDPNDSAPVTDADGDGYDAEVDCDDADPSVHPGAADPCNDQDDDCDGLVDEDGEATTWFSGWPGPQRASLSMITTSVVADLDGDGLLDLATCRDEVDVVYNPGGPWIDAGTLLAERWGGEDFDDYCDDLAAVDIDDDGDLDLLLATFYGKQLLWLTNNGDRSFSAATLFAPGGDEGEEPLAVGDFDGDGAVDVAASPSVWWNEGAGVFTPTGWPCGSGARYPAAAPLLLDGRDALLCQDGSSHIAASDRTWTSVPIDASCDLIGVQQGPVAAADLTGDGLPDTISTWDDAFVCAGDGQGRLESVARLASGPDSMWVSNLADADGDGWTDVVVNAETHDDGDLLLFRGGPDGLAPSEALRLPARLHQGGGALYQDLDGDGGADLIAWDAYTDDLYEYTRTGDGYATAWSGTVDVNFQVEVGAADLDGDGLAELIGVSDTDLVRFDSAGDHTMVERDRVVLPDDWYTWNLWPRGADLDADGDEELVAYQPGTTFLVLDHEGGELVVAGPYDTLPGDWDPKGLRDGDLDGDGDAELVIENVARPWGNIDGDDDIEYPEALWVGGLGEAGFPMTSWVDLIGEVGEGTVLALTLEADADGDGRQDLVLVDAAGVAVWSWDGVAMSLAHRSDLDWAATATDLTSHRALGVADADGDGDVDLYLALTGEAAVQVLLGDGAGGFSLGERLAAPPELVDDDEAVLADLSWDGRMDGYVWEDHASIDLLLAFRLGDAGFEAMGVQTPDAEEAPWVGDLDGDGVAEFVGADFERVLVNWGRVEVVTAACE